MDLCESEANPVYRLSSRTAKALEQWNPVSKNNKQKTKTKQKPTKPKRMSRSVPLTTPKDGVGGSQWETLRMCHHPAEYLLGENLERFGATMEIASHYGKEKEDKLVYLKVN